jgi:hypothetical protein
MDSNKHIKTNETKRNEGSLGDKNDATVTLNINK